MSQEQPQLNECQTSTTSSDLKNSITNLILLYKQKQIITNKSKADALNLLAHFNQLNKLTSNYNSNQLSTIVAEQISILCIPLNELIRIICNLFTVSKSNSYNQQLKLKVFKGFQIYISKLLQTDQDRQVIQKQALQYYQYVDSLILYQYITIFYNPQYVTNNLNQLISKVQQLLESDQGKSFLRGLKIAVGFKLQSHLNNLDIISIVNNRLKFKIDSYIFFFTSNFQNITRLLQIISTYQNKEQLTEKEKQEKKAYAYVCEKLFNAYPQLVQKLDEQNLKLYQKIKNELSMKTFHYYFNAFSYQFVTAKYIKQNLGIRQYYKFLHQNKRHDQVYSLRQDFKQCFKDQEPLPNIPYTLISNPLILNDLFAPTQTLFNQSQNELNKKKIEYLSLPRDFGINYDDVKFISSQKDLKEVYQPLLSQRIIGLDTQSQFNRLQLIQLATESNVFVFDVVVLKRYYEQQFSRFIRKIFCQNQAQILVGHSIINDKIQLKKSFGIQYLKPYTDIFQIQNISLAKLAFKYFGKPMSKYQQLSGWDIRPLRKAQLHYCALDAYLVLKLFKKLRS